MKKVLVFLFLLIPFSAKADLFTITLSQGTNTTTQGFTYVMDLFDQFENGTLNTILAGYDTTADADAFLDFRGIRMDLKYRNLGSLQQLVFDVPSIGINNLLFYGATQEEAFDAFKEYLKSNQDDLLTKILKESVSSTPYDAVAGNPSSLMSQMVDIAFSNPTLNITNQAVTSNQSGGFVILSPSGGTHKITGEDGIERTATTINLPLGYTFKFDNNWALGIDMPLSYIDLDGSITYAAQLGVSLQIPLYKDKWSLVVSGRVGATASEDSLSGGILYMASVTSNYRFDLSDKTSLTVMNMYGHIQDYTLDVKGYDIEYGLKNNVFKNGVSVKQNLSEKTALTVFGYDTRYTGSDLYIDAYDEIGLSFTRYFSGDGFFTGMDVTASYTFGDNYKAYRAELSFLF